MSTNERRISERVEALIVVALDGAHHGVTRNVSGTGLLIATRAKFKVGDRIEVTPCTTTGTIRTTGTVIRVDETPPTEPWRYRVAIQLDTELPVTIIHEGAEAAARFLGRASDPPPA